MSCGSRRAESCPARRHLVSWVAPGGIAHVVYRGYLGSYPPQVLPDSPECVALRADMEGDRLNSRFQHIHKDKSIKAYGR